MRLAAAHALICIWAAHPAIAEPMAFCSGPVRVTCIVDGDTVWIEGEKIRLADIDAPEMEGGCIGERVQSARAAGRLAELLDSGSRQIVRQGKDQHKRTLAVILVDGLSVGATLVAEGLARPWAVHRENWCGS